jgi:hypothetical protein
MITPNQHRIESLHVSNPLIYQHTFALLDQLSTFSRLKALVLHHIEPNSLEKIQPQLPHFPNHSSLSISSIAHGTTMNTVYLLIFRLPLFKYYKISSKEQLHNSAFPFATDEYSPIEHLMINSEIQEDQIDRFLSYVLQLRRLSFRSIVQSDRSITNSPIPTFKHLTNLSLTLLAIELYQTLSIFVNHCPNVEILRLSIVDPGDPGCMDDNRSN